MTLPATEFANVGVGDVDAVATDGVTERLVEAPNANRTAAEAMTSSAAVLVKVPYFPNWTCSGASGPYEADAEPYGRRTPFP